MDFERGIVIIHVNSYQLKWKNKFWKGKSILIDLKFLLILLLFGVDIMFGNSKIMRSIRVGF